jgi:hypothetical protein
VVVTTTNISNLFILKLVIKVEKLKKKSMRMWCLEMVFKVEEEISYNEPKSKHLTKKWETISSHVG